MPKNDLVVPFVEAGTYRHFKGQLYEVVGVGLDADTTRPVVVYTPLYESDTPFWVRRYEDFIAYVKVDGRSVARFTKVEA